MYYCGIKISTYTPPIALTISRKENKFLFYWTINSYKPNIVLLLED